MEILPKSLKIIYVYFLLTFFFNKLSSGARPALPMGVAPEATAECLHLDVGSTFFIDSILEFRGIEGK